MFALPRFSFVPLPLVLLPTACLSGGTVTSTGGDGDGDVEGDGDGDGDSSTCTEGEGRICAGPDACQGTQYCQDSAWSACTCPTTIPGPGTGGSPVVVSPSGGTTGDGGSTTITGGSTGVGGGASSPTDADFVVGGLGQSDDGSWRGYLFAVAADNSAIMPTEFSGSNLCVSGELGASYEEWALVGWNIAQEINPETFEGGAVNAIAPGGSGLDVTVLNNGGSGLRVQIQTDELGTESWCAEVPATGSGIIPWSAFRKECWAAGGEAYNPSIPIAQVAVQTYAGSDTMPTAFDYCVLHLGPA